MTERHYPLVVVNQPRQRYLIPILASIGLLLLLSITWISSTWLYVQPNIGVTGIEPAYVEGEPMSVILHWSDGQVIKQIDFEIPEADVKKTWYVNATRGEKRTRLPTVGWLPTLYTYTATFTTQNNKTYQLIGQFNLNKRDIVQPSSQIIGVEKNYNVGTEITYTLQAVDNRVLQKLIFMVRGTPIEQSWDVNAQQVAHPASFSTKGWEADRYYQYIFTVIDDAGNQFDTGGQFWLAEIDRIAPEATMTHIQPEYTIGDKVEYHFNATDNEKLRQIIFKVMPDRVNQIWHTSETFHKQQSSFSTKHWQAGEYEYQLQVIDHIENIKTIKGQFKLVEPAPLEMQPELFAGQLMGIKQAYKVGDTVNYSLENYDQHPIKTLVFEVQPNMKETIWREDEIAPVISNTFSTTNWQHGVYTYFITAFGQQDDILQRQQGTFTLTQPAQPFKAKVSNLLKICQQHFDAKRYTVGKKGTALACYREVLALEPHNQSAKKGLKAIEVKYHVFVESALRKQRWQSANLYLARLAEVNPNSPEINKLEKRLKKLRAQARQRNTHPKPQSKPAVASQPKKAVCPHCDCEELLTKLSIGVEPLTRQEQTYQRAHCQ